MDLNVKNIKTLDSFEIFNIILPSINEIYESNMFINLTEDGFKDIAIS